MKPLSKFLFVLGMVLPTSVYAANLVVVSGDSLNTQTTAGLAEQAHANALKSLSDTSLYAQVSPWQDTLHECSDADRAQHKCETNWLTTSASFIKNSEVGQKDIYVDVKGYSCLYKNNFGVLKSDEAIACWKLAVDNAVKKANFYCNSSVSATPVKITLDYGDMSSNEDDDNMRAIASFKCSAQ